MSEHPNKTSGGLLSPDSPLMSGLARLTVILVVGFLWTLTSLPIVTIGASSSAVYYVFLKTLRGEEENYWKDYFRAFCRDFKQATIVWLLLLAVGCVFAFSAYYYQRLNADAPQWLGYVFVALLVMILVVMIYVFPIISRFSNTVRNIFLMAVMLPVKNLKWTVALVLMAAAVALICFYFTPLIFFGYGLFAYGASLIFVKVFKPLEAAIEERTDSDHSAEAPSA